MRACMRGCVCVCASACACVCARASLKTSFMAALDAKHIWASIMRHSKTLERSIFCSNIRTVCTFDHPFSKVDEDGNVPLLSWDSKGCILSKT